MTAATSPTISSLSLAATGLDDALASAFVAEFSRHKPRPPAWSTAATIVGRAKGKPPPRAEPKTVRALAKLDLSSNSLGLLR